MLHLAIRLVLVSFQGRNVTNANTGSTVCRTPIRLDASRAAATRKWVRIGSSLRFLNWSWFLSRSFRQASTFSACPTLFYQGCKPILKIGANLCKWYLPVSSWVVNYAVDQMALWSWSQWVGQSIGSKGLKPNRSPRKSSCNKRLCLLKRQSNFVWNWAVRAAI